MHPTNLHAKSFRAWVDEAALEFGRLPTDLPDLYREFALDGSNSFSLATLASHLRNQAYQSLAAQQGIDPDKLGALADHLYLQHLVEGEALHPYLDTLETIQLPIPFRNHRTLAKIVAMEDAERWRQAVFYAYAAHKLYPMGGMPDEYRKEASWRQFQVAEAAKVLQAKGYKPEVHGGRVRFFDQYHLIADDIEARIRRIGGYELLLALCRMHKPLLDPASGRYRVGRHVGGVGAALPPQIPWAYLQNLAAKFHHKKPGEGATEESFNEILTIATALVATLDVQPYQQLDGVLLSAENIEEEMDELLLYDASFLPTQMNPPVALSMIKTVFRWVDDARLESSRGWTVASASALCAVLLGGSLGAPQNFTRGALLAALPAVPPSHVDTLLRILSHEPETINVEYRLPGDNENLSDKPLLKTLDGFYRLIDPSLCSVACVEALASDLRLFDPAKAQTRIGLSAEDLVLEEGRRRGLTVSCGEYVDTQGKVGECDVIIETPRLVIFMELKAKALTRLARGGDRVKVFDDLAKSLLYSHLQAGLHEQRLRRDDFLQLKDKKSGATYRLERRGRDVHKFALTLWEFGALQDQLFMRIFLDIAVRSVVKSDDERMDDFRTKHKKIVDLYNELVTEHPEIVRVGFTNSWFLSVSMVLSIIERTNSGSDLDSVLKKIQIVSFGTRNFFNELTNATA